MCTVSLCALRPGLTRANDVHFAEKPQRAHDSSRAIRDGRIEASQREAEPAASARRLSWDNVYDMVFTRDNGMFIRFKTLYVHFKALVSRLNRPEVRFHDIRHTYATLAIQSEIDFKTLSLSLGHATVAFTLDTYGHVSNHMSQNAAAKMEKFIGTL